MLACQFDADHADYVLALKVELQTIVQL